MNASGRLMEVTGRCHCRTISYRASVDPEKAGICHCTACQTLSGSAISETPLDLAAISRGRERRT